ncbi:DUF3558 family protein [Tomitella gaofuii]|uniref:DUF3558 family protein n=1 Tax=Tomitella gaofuii TaxID=2760083 RepID=UPI0020BF11AA|nr:DUF3558 family protein [Tomitella gaofuii]
MIACIALTASCTSTSPATAPATASPPDTTPTGMLADPCTDEMVTWFASRGLTPSRAATPSRDRRTSNCTFGNDLYSVSVMSQLASPDGSTKRWVQRVLEASGEVLPLEVAGRPAEMSIRDHDGIRQDCNVLVTVSFGFLHVTSSPRGDADVSPARDCDQTRTLAAALVTRLMDH